MNKAKVKTSTKQPTKQPAPDTFAGRLARYIFFGLLAYMPLHIFLSTVIGVQFDVLSSVKVAKEFVLLFGFGLAVAASVKKPWFELLFKDKLFWAIGLFALLHLLLMAMRPTDAEAELLALAYNTRYLLFFVYAVLLAHLYNRAHIVKRSVQIVLGVSVGVLVFGALQYSVLPHNTLERVGYSREAGVLPMFFIDDKIDFPRVMSTIRDPNSYGSYLLIIIALAASYLRIARKHSSRYLLVGVLGLALINLLFTFSRSAWLGLALVVAVLLFFWIQEGRHKKLSKDAKIIITTALIGLAVVSAGSLYAMRDNYTVQNIVFHADESTYLETPNEKRIRFWIESTVAIIENPLGHGPGTAGLPSIRNQEQGTVLNENYYLQIGYEIGIAGLLTFLTILGMVVVRLWRMSHISVTAVALLASFAGLLLTNFLVHIWANEAVAYTWWGLAGLFIVLGEQPKKKKSKRH